MYDCILKYKLEFKLKSTSNSNSNFKEEKKKSKPKDGELNPFLQILNQKVMYLNNDLKQARENYRALEEMLEAYDKGLFAKVLRINRKKEDALNRILKTELNFSKFYDKMISISEEKSIQVINMYPHSFAEACRKEGIVISPVSAHPKYLFCEEFITVTINENNFEAKAKTREGRLFIEPSDISIVVNSLKREIDRIFNREFDSHHFNNMIYTEYLTIIDNEEKKIGDPVQISKIISSLQIKKEKFKKDEFNVDLSKLILESKKSVLDYQLELIHTKNTKEGILMYRFDTSGYVGYINFRGDKKWTEK